MAGDDGPRINKFDGTDCTFWWLQIKDLYKKLYQSLSGKKHEKMESDDWKLLDRQVLGVIRLTLPKNVVHNVAEANIMEQIISLVLDMYEGHILTFVDGFCEGAMIVARGKKTGNLNSSCQDILAAVYAGANASLRNCRLGHLSKKGLKMLVSNGKLPELKIVDKLCESCIFGKQKNMSFSKGGGDLKTTKLELVHTDDVWGPSPVTSLGGSRYYGTPVEDSSMKVWIYLVKNKSEGFETFKKWESAMEGDLDSLSSNQTWELMKLPGSKKSLRNKWEYRLEHDGSMWYKERLVEKGEKEIIGYTEIFSLMVKLITIRCVLGIVTKDDLHLEKLDVKTVFLRGELDEEMKQSNGFKVRGKEKIVCKLRESLFDLKQGSRQWYVKFVGFKNDDFLRCQADHCAYVKLDDFYIILLVRVDDMLIAGECAMKDLGAAKLILGIRILKVQVEEFLMLEKILGMMNSAGTLTKAVIIGKLKLRSTSVWLHV